MKVVWQTPGAELEIPVTFVIGVTSYRGKWLMVRHKTRSTWEFPGGHVESGECPQRAMVRELYEEAGASVKHMECCGSIIVTDINVRRGMVYRVFANQLYDIPNYEMEERLLTKRLPKRLTYEEINREIFLHRPVFKSQDADLLGQF